MHTFNMLSPRWVADSPLITNVPEPVVIKAALTFIHRTAEGRQAQPLNMAQAMLKQVRRTWHRILREGNFNNL